MEYEAPTAMVKGSGGASSLMVVTAVVESANLFDFHIPTITSSSSSSLYIFGHGTIVSVTGEVRR
jgi:hypothetical protein